MLNHGDFLQRDEQKQKIESAVTRTPVATVSAAVFGFRTSDLLRASAFELRIYRNAALHPFATLRKALALI